MFKKGTKLYSIIKNKCPQCHEGNFFKHRFTYTPKKVIKLHENCSNCNLKYVIEPGFFYGAMYVGYAITVATSILAFLIAILIFNTTFLQSLGAIFGVLFFMMPINLRLSRIIWINMFVEFDKH
ncbi:MAG: DUF983 domain-containing protein [Polaribacter sp.]|nr:DUF983 domain-containing protein [Polaribacter sp.]